MIRTVLGDIPENLLGVTYMHEHLIIDSEIVKRDLDFIYLPSSVDAIAEASICKASGVDSMVDCMPTGSGRNIRKLAEISERTGINVIATTGLHNSKYYEKDDALLNMNSEQLSEVFIGEIVEGCDGTRHKAGIIKILTTGVGLNDSEKILFEAAAIAHKQTGAPILTHCEHGTGAVEQIDALEALKVDLENVILSHTDKEPDFGYHREILSSGVNVEYDQLLRQNDFENSSSALLTAEMFEQGFGSQIMLGTDGARRTLWTVLGGSPGLASLYTNWSIKLKEVGLTNENLKLMFESNPAKFLSF